MSNTILYGVIFITSLLLFIVSFKSFQVVKKQRADEMILKVFWNKRLCFDINREQRDDIATFCRNVLVKQYGFIQKSDETHGTLMFYQYFKDRKPIESIFVELKSINSNDCIDVSMCGMESMREFFNIFIVKYLINLLKDSKVKMAITDLLKIMPPVLGLERSNFPFSAHDVLNINGDCIATNIELAGYDDTQKKSEIKEVKSKKKTTKVEVEKADDKEKSKTEISTELVLPKTDIDNNIQIVEKVEQVTSSPAVVTEAPIIQIEPVAIPVTEEVVIAKLETEVTNITPKAKIKRLRKKRNSVIAKKDKPTHKTTIQPKIDGKRVSVGKDDKEKPKETKEERRKRILEEFRRREWHRNEPKKIWERKINGKLTGEKMLIGIGDGMQNSINEERRNITSKQYQSSVHVKN